MDSRSDQVPLQNEFLKALGPFNSLLRAMGVDLQLIPSTKSIKIRAGFLLALHIQSEIFMFIRRGCLPFIQLMFNAEQLLIDGTLTETFNSALFRITYATTEALSHSMLLFTIRPTLRRFFSTLTRSVEPHFDPSRIRLYSVAALAHLLALVLKKYFSDK